MDEISEANKTIFTFCFGTSNKTVQLTQQQLHHFPYLVTLVAHADDFSSAKNDNGEYILNYPIQYNWFMPIFQSLIRKQPFALFTELSHEANALDMLQLYDYLCVNPLPVPLLKGKTLVRSNRINTQSEDNYVKDRRANLSEARDMAIQFIIAVSKNEYNLNDSKTLNSIFSLITSIFSNPNIFHSRFRYHTLTVVKKYCFSLFSETQQLLLPSAQQITGNLQIDSWIYLYDDDQPLPENFDDAFSWIYHSTEEYINNLAVSFQPSTFSFDPLELDFFDGILWSTTTDTEVLLQKWQITDTEPLYRWQSSRYTIIGDNSKHRRPNLLEFINLVNFENNGLYSYQIEEEQAKEEAKSARSGHFNTLPKRPKVDKFKHRSGPKAQKHR